MKTLYLTAVALLLITIKPFAQCTVTISGDTCEGQVLTAHATGTDVQQLLWKRSNQLVFTSTVKNGFNPNGITVAGGNGQGTADNQISPSDIFIDNANNIYVSDVYNDRVQKWVPGTTEGITVAGGNGEGNAANQLSSPIGIYVDENGNIYIADDFNDRIQKWTVGASEGITVAGGNGHGSAANQFSQPVDIFVIRDTMFIADAGNHRIQKWIFGATEGVAVAGGHGIGSNPNQLHTPSSVYVDSAGNIYIADQGNNRVQKWTPNSTKGVNVAGGNGSGSNANQVDYPHGIVVDNLHNLYVSESFNNRVQKWAPGATEGITVAGGNGIGSDSNQLFGPGGLNFDSLGDLYVADYQNRRIQKFVVDSSVNGIDTTYIPTAGGLYTVIAVFKNSCIDTSEAVNIKALPHIYHIKGQKRSLCGGGDFAYSIRPFDDASTVYNWNVPTGATLLSGQGTPSIRLRIPGTGFSGGALTITAQNSCGSGPAFTDTLSTKPVRPDLITGPAFIDYHDTAVYSTSSDVEGVTYHWEVPGGVEIISGQGTTNITVVWNSPFHGTVKVFTSLCTDEASMQYLKVQLGSSLAAKAAANVSLEKNRLDVNNPPVLYPNPSNKSVTVTITANRQGKVFVQFTDLAGKVFFTKSETLVKGINNLEFDISNFAKGIYLLSVKDGQIYNQLFKVIKQ